MTRMSRLDCSRKGWDGAGAPSGAVKAGARARGAPDPAPRSGAA